MTKEEQRFYRTLSNLEVLKEQEQLLKDIRALAQKQKKGGIKDKKRR